MTQNGLPNKQGLYDPLLERDACGVGFVAYIDGRKDHSIVSLGLEVLVNMTHRGGVGADPRLGDGAGLLIQLPDAFLRAQCKKQHIDLPPEGEYGVGMIFLPKNDLPLRKSCQNDVDHVIREEGQQVLGWREVPIDPMVNIGYKARVSEPAIFQVFIGQHGRPKNTDDNADELWLERKLYIIRRRIENKVLRHNKAELRSFHIASMSSRTMLYKGWFLPVQIDAYYPELRDPTIVSAFAMVHQRYSTNTFPSWGLAQPFRMVCHNGEINTLRGNINWMRAREAALVSPLFGEDLKKLFPIIPEGLSDSASFDRAVEFLVLSGRSLPHAMMMLIPEAWENHQQMDPDRRAFYQYHGALMEPWDGPAAMAFTDGRYIGATLDRNGLRPARYLHTKDGLCVMASEAGTTPFRPEEEVCSGRLRPGRMFVIDLHQGRIIDDTEIKAEIVARQPYRQWLTDHLLQIEHLSPGGAEGHEAEPLHTREHIFGYSEEDLKVILAPMAQTGEEPVGSMGNDSALPILSERPVLLFNYFKQLFAQVTNPPIDPIREELVMSLFTQLGPTGNLLADTPENVRRIWLAHPILTNSDLEKIRAVSVDPLRAHTHSTLYPVDSGAPGLEAALEQLCSSVSASVEAGFGMIILSDRGVNATLAPLPILLAAAGVHHHLIRSGTRNRVSIIVETAEAREVHHCALLVGYGVGAINPYLALEILTDMVERRVLSAELTPQEAHKRYIKAINKGMLKIFSKMGISTLRSYCGAQIFEAVGLNQQVIDWYFTGTTSRIGGINLEIIAEEGLRRHRRAYYGEHVDPEQGLDVGGEYHFRRGGERHMWTPETIATLQRAVRENSYALYQEFARAIEQQSRNWCTLRGLLHPKLHAPHPAQTAPPASQARHEQQAGQAVHIQPAATTPARPTHTHYAIPLDEVEPATEIVKRFVTGAMSFGSISKEAHETLAIAMNRLGGRSNTGEGGEDPERFKPRPNGDFARSAIKQVASGRFGVTSHYLVNADEIQIKIAQGAKPGEGGQLPGYKVDQVIARTRNTTPGVTLISPPPHHDIYSIEDLAQLIFDLKNTNPDARISVKLVSEVGVGVIAAGVAKAHADMILISGGDGGTGASPLSSIKYAGVPWELGLAETQQTLVLNDLRGRVRLQTDGQLRTGRDVVIAALLGAEEFGFATTPLVASGCVMMRKCHLGTCPVGVATQDPDLRKKFTGQAQHVVNYFHFVATEVREIMAAMGVRHLDDLIGRVDLIQLQQAAPHHWKAQGLDLADILKTIPVPVNVATRCVTEQDHGIATVLDRTLLVFAKQALTNQTPVDIHLSIRNTDRTVGAMLGGVISKRFGAAGLPAGTINCHFEGVAGQSFGAFNVNGVALHLLGAANDYVGKGMSGGRIVIRPSPRSTLVAEDNIIVGNTLLYGATGGAAYIRGIAGERFAVRNSGATAVVEGVGDHGCEYMTGGIVVVLGQTGRNFAAGMSGGMAFVFDRDHHFAALYNPAMVALQSVDIAADQILLRGLLEHHFQYTESTVAAHILADWEASLAKFVKVMPFEYQRVLAELQRQERKANG